MSGDPGIGNPHSLFRRPEFINYRSLNYKLNNAIKHGAKGFLYVQDPLSLAGGTEGNPRFNPLEGGGYRFDLLSGQVLNRWADQLLASAKITTLSWQKQIADSQVPASLALEEKVHLVVSLQKKVGQISNVLGFVQGTDEQLKHEVVVIGAHFDHLGYGSSSSREGTTVPVIHNGADDNASGTAMVLELAERIKKNPMKRSYVFAFFNAEEIGLLGSKYFVESWKGFESDFGNIKAMLNFDMVGRYQKELQIMGVGSGLEWNQLLDHLDSRALSINQVAKSIGSSDHASFLNSKIPVLYFTTGTHDDYHRSTDDFEKINFEAMAKIADISFDLLKREEELTTINYNPAFPNDDDQGGARGYGSHLGCVPNFGQSEDIVGVECSKATVGSPAEKAGILPGDVVIQLGDIEIKNIYDLVFVLKFYRAGDPLVLKWKRNGVIMSAAIVLAPPA